MLQKITIVLFLFLATGCGTGYDKSEVEARFKEVQSIAKVGMPFEEAKRKLEEAGYKVSRKVSPTKKNDSFVSHVPLVNNIPIQSILAETTGKGSGPRTNAIILMNQQSIITKVE